MTWHESDGLALRSGARWMLPIAVVVGMTFVASCSAANHPRHHSPAITLPPAQQAQLVRGITARTVRAESVVLAPQLRAAFMREGRPLLPAGSRLAIRKSSFRSGTSQTATVDAVVTGSSPGRWQLLLVRHDGQWLLIGTRRLP